MHGTVRSRLVSAALAALLLAVPACGDDDDESTSTTTAGGSGTTTSTSGEALACEPVGDGGGTSVPVTLTEWSVAADPDTVPAGKMTFRARNEGSEVHELVVVKGDDPSGLPTKDGKVEEDTLPSGAFIGEIEGFPGGGVTCPGTFELAAGKYVLFCNIVEEEDGEIESHYDQGMYTAFTVT